MNKCPNCGHENRAGEILCTNCSTALVEGVSTSTKKISEAEQAEVSKAFGEDVLKQDQTNDVFPVTATLRLEIVGSPMPIKVKFTKSNLTLGRRDPATGALPDIDLAPFAGYRMGVSRRHSEIRRNEEGHLELLDLGSSNGTFLNGQRLPPHTPYRVQNRDKMALGQIVMEVIYQVDMPASETKAKNQFDADETNPTRPESLMTQPTKPEKLKKALEDVSAAITSASQKSETVAEETEDDVVTKPIDQETLDSTLAEVEKPKVDVATVKLTNEARENLLDEAQKSAQSAIDEAQKTSDKTETEPDSSDDNPKPSE